MSAVRRLTSMVITFPSFLVLIQGSTVAANAGANLLNKSQNVGRVRVFKQSRAVTVVHVHSDEHRPGRIESPA